VELLRRLLERTVSETPRLVNILEKSLRRKFSIRVFGSVSVSGSQTLTLPKKPDGSPSVGTFVGMLYHNGEQRFESRLVPEAIVSPRIEELKQTIKVCMFDQYGTVVDMQSGLTEVACIVESWRRSPLGRTQTQPTRTAASFLIR